MPLNCDTDSDTLALLEIVVWNLKQYFGHTPEQAYSSVNSFYALFAGQWVDAFYHEEMPYRVAARVHFVIELQNPNDQFSDWLINSPWRDQPAESLRYFREKYFNTTDESEIK